MLQVFYFDVLYVLQRFSNIFYVFLQVFQMHVSNVLSALKRMLQLLHLDVSKVDRVLHLLPCFLLPCLSVLLPASAGHPLPPPLFLDAGDVQGGVGPT